MTPAPSNLPRNPVPTEPVTVGADSTQNNSEIVSFARVTNFMCYSLNKSFLPGEYEAANFLRNYEK